VLINCLVNMWGETASIFAGALIPTYLAAVNEAKTHYLTPTAQGKNIVIANAFAKASESGIGLRIASNALSSEGGDVVLIANAPEGQVTHYLTSSFGRGNRQRTLPPNVNHLITYTEYPEMTSVSGFAQSDKVLFLHKWDEVIQVLQKFHGANTRVAVFPNADIQI
jgi:hypothetical protein